jgi:hypothetical protein
MPILIDLPYWSNSCVGKTSEEPCRCQYYESRDAVARVSSTIISIAMRLYLSLENFIEKVLIQVSGSC